MKTGIAVVISFIMNLAMINAFAQISPTKEISLDSLRKRDMDVQKKILEYNSKYVQYTTVERLKDSTELLPLDTTLHNFQSYSPIAQSKNPTIGLGSLGLAYRDLLFNPPKTIGFDAGFHSLDAYWLNVDSVRYYRARSPYTELYYIDGRKKEQTFRVIHSQNVNPYWNFGANYNRIDAMGFYDNQEADHLNAALFTWFESKKKRYKLLATAVFNNIIAAENGSVRSNNIFDLESNFSTLVEPVKLNGQGPNMPRQTWQGQALFIKQFYSFGKRDSIKKENKALSTQEFSHAITYDNRRYRFYRNEEDQYEVFPKYISIGSITTTDDYTHVRNLRNEINYKFYLPGKTSGLLRNELKINVGAQYDLYQYQQLGYESVFDNLTLKAGLGYRLSDRSKFDLGLQQIVEGAHAGDFLYDARSNFLLGQTAGKITLGVYSQNKSPQQLFERSNYQFHQWEENFDRTKIHNFSFLYENPKAKLALKTEYFLISNYLYFKEIADRQIEPKQFDENINLLKVTFSKNFKVWRFNSENHIVYQKSNYQDILSTPEIYVYSSLYYQYTFFKILHTNIGFDVRYNTPYEVPSYAVNVSQFYNSAKPIVYDSYPIVDCWIKATLKRANLFLKYDYVNQGMFSEGFYSVNRYPMHDGAIKLGISWKFYD